MPNNKLQDELHIAAKDDDLARMKEILKTGVNVNQPHSQFFTPPLSWAAQNGKLAATKLLLERGASVNSTSVIHNANHTVPLEYAMEGKNAAVIKLLAQTTQEYLEERFANYSSLSLIDCLELIFQSLAFIYYHLEIKSELFIKYFFKTLEITKQIEKKIQGMDDIEEHCLCLILLARHHIAIARFLLKLQKAAADESGYAKSVQNFLLSYFDQAKQTSSGQESYNAPQSIPAENTIHRELAIQYLDKAASLLPQIADHKKAFFSNKITHYFGVLGDFLDQTNNFKEKINCISKAIAITLEEENLNCEILSKYYSYLGNTQLKLGQLAEAGDSFKQVHHYLTAIAQIDAKFSCAETIVATLNKLGRNFLTQKKYAAAIFCFEQGMQLFTPIALNAPSFDNYRILVGFYFELTLAQICHNPQAIVSFGTVFQYLEKIPTVNEKVQFARHIVKRAEELVKELLKNNQFMQIVACYEFIIAIHPKEDADDNMKLIFYYSELGIKQIGVEKYDDGVKSFLVAYDCLIRIEDKAVDKLQEIKKLAGVLSHWGYALFAAELYPLAVTCFEYAIKLHSNKLYCSSTQNSDLSNMYYHLGNTQLLLNQLEAATASYGKSYDYLLQVPDEPQKYGMVKQFSTYLRSDLTGSFLTKGEFKQANVCLLQVIKVLQTITCPQQQDYVELAECYDSFENCLLQLPFYKKEYCEMLARLFRPRASIGVIKSVPFILARDIVPNQLIHRPVILAALTYLFKVYDRDDFPNQEFRKELADEKNKNLLEEIKQQLAEDFPSLQKLTEGGLAFPVAAAKKLQKQEGEIASLKKQVEDLGGVPELPIPDEKTQPRITAFFAANNAAQKRKSEENEKEEVTKDSKKQKTEDSDERSDMNLD